MLLIFTLYIVYIFRLRVNLDICFDFYICLSPQGHKIRLARFLGERQPPDPICFSGEVEWEHTLLEDFGLSL